MSSNNIVLQDSMESRGKVCLDEDVKLELQSPLYSTKTSLEKKKSSLLVI